MSRKKAAFSSPKSQSWNILAGKSYGLRVEDQDWANLVEIMKLLLGEKRQRASVAWGDCKAECNLTVLQLRPIISEVSTGGYAPLFGQSDLFKI